MTNMDPSLAGWDWEDPDKLAVTLMDFTERLARCETLEQVARPLPVTRDDFRDIGLTGIEFAAFKTTHPAGLGTDLVGLRTPTMSTVPGPLYRADGTNYFTQLDISEKLPFGDGCVEWVYAEHLIEHVPPPVAIGWLAEVRRVLVPGGLLRLTTPDLHKYAREYLSGDGFFAKQRRRLQVMRFGPPMPERRAFMVNQIFYLYGHRWLYDLEELRYVLARAGFESPVQLCSFQAGARADVAALDTVLRRLETIYVEVTA
ncbi:MAG: methyltransferase domain-containing protein [Micromonosporaceae bacterium]